MKQKKRWVLIADGARARVFVRDHGTLEEAYDHDFIGDNARLTSVGRDEPGRTFESAYPGRHAYQPHTDWHQHQKDLLAKEVCEALNDSSYNKEFDELIIIAPPKMLGDIRSHLSKWVDAKVTAEITKDITKYTEAELIAYLEHEV